MLLWEVVFNSSQHMIGFLFILFLLTIIVGMVIASSADELHAIYLKLIDTVHHCPAEQYYKQMKQTQINGEPPPAMVRSFK